MFHQSILPLREDTFQDSRLLSTKYPVLVHQWMIHGMAQ